MVGVGFVELFYSIVANTQEKGGIACIVCPQACGVWHRFISVGSRSFNNFLNARTPASFNPYMPLRISRFAKPSGDIFMSYSSQTSFCILEGCTRMYR